MEVLINNSTSCIINSSLSSCLPLASPLPSFLYKQSSHHHNHQANHETNDLINRDQDNSVIINGYKVSDWNLYEARQYEHEIKDTPISVGWDFIPSDFDGYHIIDHLRDNMMVIYILAAMYVFGVFYGQKFMANRKPLQLKGVTIAWNVFLAIFSTICFVKFTAESWNVYWRPLYQEDYDMDASSKDDYLRTSTGNTSSLIQNGAARIPYGGVAGIICHTPTGYGSHAFWQLLFIASKVWEFGDTFLLISRKKPVIFLHWFHHTTVLLLSCFIGGRNSSLRRVFANVNSGIHALMYAYYAIVAAGYRFPRSVSMTITASQLIQMVIGVYACVKSYSICIKPDGVPIDHSSATFSLVIYASYLLLFAQFFHKAYIARKGAKKSASSDKKTPASTDKVENNGHPLNGVVKKENDMNNIVASVINNNEERILKDR